MHAFRCIETDNSCNSLSPLIRPLMCIRNLNQMIVHKPRLKPRDIPDIRINNTWNTLILSSSDKCRSSLWSRVSTLFSSGAAGVDGVVQLVLEDLVWGLTAPRFAASQSNRLRSGFNVGGVTDNGLSPDFAIITARPTRLVDLQYTIGSLFKSSNFSALLMYGELGQRE